MSLTREQCLKWAEESKMLYGIHWCPTTDALEALCNRVRDETLEEAAKLIDSTDLSGLDSDRKLQRDLAVILSAYAEAIRERKGMK